jgi:hypothetical protein
LLFWSTSVEHSHLQINPRLRNSFERSCIRGNRGVQPQMDTNHAPVSIRSLP